MSRVAKKNPPTKLSLTVQYAGGAQNTPTRAQFRRWIKVALQREANNHYAHRGRTGRA